MALLTPNQAAKHLGISTHTLHALRKGGEIPYVNVGLGKQRERPRYEVEDLDTWIKSRKKTATAFLQPARRRGTFAAQNSQADYNRMCVENFQRAMAERKARRDARAAMLAAADEKRRLYAEGVAARRAERARKKARCDPHVSK